LLTLWFFNTMPDIHFLGLIWAWHGFMLFWASISMATCFYLSRDIKKDSESGGIDLLFSWLFACATCVYATSWIWSFAQRTGTIFSLSMQGFAILLWSIEVPFLIVIGNSLKEKIFRYFGYGLTICLAARLIELGFFKNMPIIHFLGFSWGWVAFVSFWSAMSMATCFYLTQRMKKVVESNSIDVFFDQIFSGALCAYSAVWILSAIRYPWQAFSLSLEGIGLLGLSILLALRRFRVYAYLVLGGSGLIFIFQAINVFSLGFRWFLIAWNTLVFFGIYYLIKQLKSKSNISLFFDNEEMFSFWVAMVVLIFAIYQYIYPQWISLSLGIASVLVILIGFWDGSKMERLGGMGLLALTLGRVALVDLSGLDTIFKIITLIILGVLFLGVSYIYNRFSTEKSRNS